MFTKLKTFGILFVALILLLGLTISASADEEYPPSVEPTVVRSVDNPVSITAPLSIADILTDSTSDLITPKVIGGLPVSPENKYPWMASTQFYSSNICGGTLISPEWVLTAAHCWTSEINEYPYYAVIIPGEERIVLGEYDLYTNSGHEQTMEIAEVYVHPDFDPFYLSYDVALLKLATPATINSYVSTINLTNSTYTNQVLANFDGIVAGWGVIDTTSGTYPDVMYEAYVDFLADTACSYYGASYDPVSMLCAGKVDGSRDTCYGDSGGPVAFQENGVWKQAGITSWGNECGLVNFPGVYTRVSAVYDWVRSIVPIKIEFNGGLEISADQPVVSISRPHIGIEIMAYNGVSEGSQINYLPMLFNQIWNNFTATFTVQNVTNSVATFTITFKDAALGETTCVISDQVLNPHGVRTYDMADLGTCDGGYSFPVSWAGSAMIESDQNLAVMATPYIYGTNAVTYTAFSGGAPVAYLPMLFRGIWGFDAAFYVQNLDPSSNANITIEFFDNDGNRTCSYDDPVDLKPAETRGYWMPIVECDGEEDFPTKLVDGKEVNWWAGSAVIRTETTKAPSTNIVAIARPHVKDEIAVYNGFSSGTTQNYLPMLFREIWSGFTAAYYIQNVTDQIVDDIFITYYDLNGNLTCTYTDPTPIQPYATRGYWMPTAECDDGSGSFPATGGWAGSAVIETNGDVVVVARPHLKDGQVVAYNAFTTGTNHTYLPFNFKNTPNHGTAVYIQNLGTENANTLIQFFDEESGFMCEMSKVIVPGAPEAIWLDSITEADCP